MISSFFPPSFPSLCHSPGRRCPLHPLCPQRAAPECWLQTLRGGTLPPFRVIISAECQALSSNLQPSRGEAAVSPYQPVWRAQIARLVFLPSKPTEKHPLGLLRVSRWKEIQAKRELMVQDLSQARVGAQKGSESAGRGVVTVEKILAALRGCHVLLCSASPQRDFTGRCLRAWQQKAEFNGAWCLLVSGEAESPSVPPGAPKCCMPLKCTPLEPQHHGLFAPIKSIALLSATLGLPMGSMGTSQLTQCELFMGLKTEAI